MATDYTKRLRIPIDTHDTTPLYSQCGDILCFDYTCIVLGGRGPYVECIPWQIDWFNFTIPTDLLWKTYSNSIDYVEYRSTRDWVKLYLQKRTVDYAAYKIDHCYISPFDCYFRKNNGADLIKVIDPLR